MIVTGSVISLPLRCNTLLTYCTAVVRGGLGQHITTLVTTPKRIVIFIKVGQIANTARPYSLDPVLPCHVLHVDNVGHTGKSVNLGSVHLNFPNRMVHQDLLRIHSNSACVRDCYDSGCPPHLSASKFHLGSNCEGHLWR